MSGVSGTGGGLWQLSTARLEDLRSALARGGGVVTATGLEGDGFGQERACVGGLVGLPRPHALIVVDAVLDERRRRPPPGLDLVWSGPDPAQAESRDPGQVLREIFEGARRSVIVAGFAFFAADRIFEALHARAVAEPTLELTFFIHADALPAFDRYTWPWTDHKPALYVDARGAGDASMHAKCVVVDEKVALITSANFTERAQRDNVELGVLVRDPAFARRVAAQWRVLVARGLFVPG